MKEISEKLVDMGYEGKIEYLVGSPDRIFLANEELLIKGVDGTWLVKKDADVPNYHPLELVRTVVEKGLEIYSIRLETISDFLTRTTDMKFYPWGPCPRFSPHVLTAFKKISTDIKKQTLDDPALSLERPYDINEAVKFIKVYLMERQLRY